MTLTLPPTSDSTVREEPPLEAAFRAALGGGALNPAQAAFMDQAEDDYDPNELPGVGLDDLAVGFGDFWAWAAQRESLDPAIRIVPATGSDGRDLGLVRLEILQDDRPFLVDSVMGEIAENGLHVRAMFHAVVPVARDADHRRLDQGETHLESMIQVIFDPLASDVSAKLLAGIEITLLDVRRAVGDHAAMRARMDSAIAELDAQAAHFEPSALQEYEAFLEWLKADHFIFLGARTYDYPRNPDGSYAAEEPLDQPEDSLGVLRDLRRGVLRRDNEPAILSRELQEHLKHDAPVTVARSNLHSRVHRRTTMDYVGVRRYGPDGSAIGEIRFVGLFTSEAYDAPAVETPLIRRKIAYVLKQAGAAPKSHSDRRLRNVLENYPRDELLQASEDELLQTALKIVHLNDRPRVRLFARLDPFDRFVSVLLFLPRDAYQSELADKAGALLTEAFHGVLQATYPTFSDAPLARVQYIISVEPGRHPTPDLEALEAAITEASRSWASRLEAALREDPRTRDSAAAVAQAYQNGFPAGYRDLYPVEEAINDIEVIDSLAEGEPVRVRAYRRATDSVLSFRFKLYRPGGAAPLADVLPILERMGLKAMVEEGFPIRRAGADGETRVVWTHEFQLDDERGESLVFDDIKAAFEAAFVAVWTGRTENDGFNRLVLELGVSWREAALVRALARYRQQSGLDPSEAVQALALTDNPNVTRLILDLFRTQFDPAIQASADVRVTMAGEVMEEIQAALQSVESLDADRVLRRLAALTRALTRTNYYQTGPDGEPKPYISFKIASRQLDDLPQPKPYREIFVWAPHVEGVHLRFGPVARGGLRWSDRRDDFRTEVLGLVKAQQVKNAVIVPVGSKGGFYPKQSPRGGSAEAVRAEAVRAYKTFLSGLLDVTDNLSADGQVIRPPAVVALDGDDPYLVVAADKGTATFSDIANGVAEDYGFWLGDAFASGGSVGYDHKAMGITARGAWEAVKRHFREMGKDIQKEPFTVAGVGDMSGDVFGNGMLLSEKIRLVAAFDHRDIFIDPNPDPAVSFAERKRLFDLPRSSWASYDASLISPGGGVFSRSLKSIELTDEIKALLDLKADAVTPTELMNAILKARVELLYLGGVGTYVKAPFESHLDVGDKANDALRVDATQLRCKVIGEGANLGVTQSGRIVFARAGGRIDTDAIDNSAGVDTSDHEVNIKILTGLAEGAGRLDRPSRNALLASMTDEVGTKVLRHNYDQTLALSLLQVTAAEDLESQNAYMAQLEAKGALDRALERLPDSHTVADLAQAGQGLSRPELSVLLAYAKLDLVDQIIASQGPDDPYFVATLQNYFPKALGPFADEMKRHRLRREIIATVVGNDMVNICGPTFPSRLREAVKGDARTLVVGYAASKEILRFDEAWEAVAALDGKAPAAAQHQMFKQLASVLRAQTFSLAQRSGGRGLVGQDAAIKVSDVTVKRLMDFYRPRADELRHDLVGVLSSFEQRNLAKRVRALVKDGAPEDVARQVAMLRSLTVICDLADLARAADWPVVAVARIYHQAGASFGFERVRQAAASLPGRDSFERRAVRRLGEDLMAEQAALTRVIMAFSAGSQAGEDAARARSTVASWSSLNAQAAQAARDILKDVEEAPGGWSFAKLTIASSALRELTVGVK
ncbi:NAD-glutamate dehydrogenase [Phenylobacterium montanum]|uniref:NAD-glutamate dehydrogenase n=1 Tax=Phenylobacterium montanum TaxID=2823693 RepID=A0A975ITH3_9CAUL|nr:NAD-glutamate dehydrogenase [Caulobacter sp. S6]QUD86867.1 NAD-glutamate dehydrogenase [Caulobacter sp. S6]